MTQVLDSHALVGGVRIAHRDGGKGRPVVLVHGTPSHSYIWRNVIPGLERAGCRVLAFDLLGYGLSERPVDADTSVVAQARVLEQMLDVWGLERADLVGHDIGGATAMIVAIRRPRRVRTLTLIDTVSYESWPSHTWREIIREHLHEYHRLPLDDFRAMLVRQLEMTVHDKKRMSGEVLQAYLRPLAGEIGKASFFAHQVSHYDSRYTEGLTEDLRRLAAPTKILWGQDDRWQPTSYARRLAGDIPGADLTLVPAAGHFLMEDAADRVVTEIDRFLDRNGQAPAGAEA